MSICNPMSYDRPTPFSSYMYMPMAWPEAPYFLGVSAFSRRNLLAAFIAEAITYQPQSIIRYTAL